MYLLQREVPTSIDENAELEVLCESFDLEQIKEDFVKAVYSGIRPGDLIIVKQLPLAWNLQVTTENVQEWEDEEYEGN